MANHTPPTPEPPSPLVAASESSPSVTLLATHALPTQLPFRASPPPSHHDKRPPSKPPSSAGCFFSSAQWSADGTSALVTRSDKTISALVLPPDLLEPSAQPRGLASHGTTTLPEPTQCIVGSPFFSLAAPATQTFLAACRDHPIQLFHAFASPHTRNLDTPSANANTSSPLCSYKLIKHETEAYISPSAILWPQPGTHFLAGSANRVDYFDLSRHGASSAPITTIPTIPSRRHVLKGGGVGMKGTVSALAAQSQSQGCEGLVAAGMRTRWMGLYDLGRADKAVAHWSIAGAERDEFGTNVAAGQGIVQALWSACGRYLVINERQAAGLLVYDIRVSGKLLSVLAGRKAQTQQRLSCDVFGNGQGGQGFEVWGGDQEGTVHVWDEIGLHYGARDPSWGWRAHGAPVCSSIVHASGSVALSCSGAWDYTADEDVPRSRPGSDSSGDGSRTRVLDESSVKVWSIANVGTSS